MRVPPRLDPNVRVGPIRDRYALLLNPFVALLRRARFPRGLAVLTGNLAPDGALIKVAGLKSLVFEGRARVFDSEEACSEVVKKRAYKAGEVLVIRAKMPKFSATYDRAERMPAGEVRFWSLCSTRVIRRSWTVSPQRRACEPMPRWRFAVTLRPPSHTSRCPAWGAILRGWCRSPRPPASTS